MKRIIESYLASVEEKAQALESSSKARLDIRSLRRVSVDPGMLFVDGGNQSVIETPGYSFHLLHVACVVVEGEQMSTYRDEYLAIVTNAQDQSTCKVHHLPDESEVVTYTGDPDTIIDEIRRILELEAARLHVANLTQGALVVIDGTLESRTDREKAALDKLFKSSQCLPVGIAKTTDMGFDTGLSVFDVLHRYEEGGLRYAKVGEHDGVATYVTRLHEHSRYWFRIDIAARPGIDPERILGQLATLSNDGAFLGYPYPLIKADLLARVSNAEAGQLRTELLHRHPEMQALERQAQVHAVLDTMRF